MVGSVSSLCKTSIGHRRFSPLFAAFRRFSPLFAAFRRFSLLGLERPMLDR